MGSSGFTTVQEVRATNKQGPAEAEAAEAVASCLLWLLPSPTDTDPDPMLTADDDDADDTDDANDTEDTVADDGGKVTDDGVRRSTSSTGVRHRGHLAPVSV